MGTAKALENQGDARNEHLLRAVIEGTTDAVFVKDRQGRYLMVNDAVSVIMNRRVDEVIGRHDRELFPEPTAKKIESDDRRVLDGGRPQEFETRIPVNGDTRTFLSTKTVCRGDDGRIIGLIGISRDITRRIQAETALRATNQILQTLIKASPLPIISFDPQGRIRWWNLAAEKTFGWTQEEVLEQLPPFVPPDKIEQFRANFQRCLNGEALRGLEVQRCRKDGSKVDMAIWAAPLRDDEHRITGVMALVADLTERKSSEAALRELQQENVYLRTRVQARPEYAEIIGQSEALKTVLQRVELVAGTDSTVLITGATGTGKELLARAIHQRSRRRDQVLVTVNCATLPATLIESELFGHEKGAFTGAATQKIGRFELADGGTIFLDEIGDLPLELQAKLLRVLQDGEFERLGLSVPRRVDVRVIAATNHDLERAVTETKFRADLYYRLQVFPIRVPLLCERKADIPDLVRHFAQKYATRMGKNITSIPNEVLAKLMDYDWPGNVRELQNVVERAVIFSDNGEPKLIEWPPSSTADKQPDGAATLQQVQREHIRNVLRQTNGRIRGADGAARILGLKPTTLESRMKKLGINRRDIHDKTL